MSDVTIGGRAPLSATLDREDAESVVVACPPHPQMGGDRNDPRLLSVSDALGDRGIGCLRFDYGPWDGGRGEVEDALTVLQWAADRFERVGLFGYSFGGAAALLAATDWASESATTDLWAVSALSPAGDLGGRKVTAAVETLDRPLQVVYGDRDDAVDSTPVANAARERGGSVSAVAADHFFVGQREHVGALVADFFDLSTEPQKR